MSRKTYAVGYGIRITDEILFALDAYAEKQGMTYSDFISELKFEYLPCETGTDNRFIGFTLWCGNPETYERRLEFLSLADIMRYVEKDQKHLNTTWEPMRSLFRDAGLLDVVGDDIIR